MNREEKDIQKIYQFLE